MTKKMIRWEELKLQEVYSYDIVTDLHTMYIEEYTWGTVTKMDREISPFKIYRRKEETGKDNKFNLGFLHGGKMEYCGQFNTVEEAKKKAEKYWEVNK